MPKKKKQINFTHLITLKVHKDLYAYYKELADKKGITLSKLLRVILENHKNILDNT